MRRGRRSLTWRGVAGEPNQAAVSADGCPETWRDFRAGGSFGFIYENGFTYVKLVPDSCARSTHAQRGCRRCRRSRRSIRSGIQPRRHGSTARTAIEEGSGGYAPILVARSGSGHFSHIASVRHNATGRALGSFRKATATPALCQRLGPTERRGACPLLAHTIRAGCAVGTVARPARPPSSHWRCGYHRGAARQWPRRPSGWSPP